MVDLFIFAGESSGDLHGENLLKALFTDRPTLDIVGVAGPRMRTQPMRTLLQMEEFQVMGFVDVLLALPKLIRLFYKVARTILEMNPKAVITIDYPGFNLRLARYLRKQGFQGKLIHFICPSVWAHGKQRIPLMEKTLDLLLCILPFEPSLFKRGAFFVGHPLSERLRTHVYQPFYFGNKPLLSLFPGSRRHEIERNLKTMLQACDPRFQIALSLANEQFRPLMESIVSQAGLNKEDLLWVPASLSYELMQHSSLSIAKSGTVTLELAFHKVPTVVVYAVSFLDRLIAYHLLRIRLPFYCLVNIIAGHEVFPELIGPHFTLENLKTQLAHLSREKIHTECSQLISSLGSKNASQEASAAILSLL
jgi:lipid-A-disaccharide synthase